MPVHSGHGWLPAFLPADSTRYRVDDPVLAAALADAGMKLVAERPEVEIAPPGRAGGDASCTIVVLSEPPARRGPRPLRGSLHVARAVRVRVRAALARRELRGLGYERPAAVRWDLNRRIVRRRSLDPKDWLPLRALVIARRGEPGRTILDAAAAAAGLDPASIDPVVRQAGVVAFAGASVLRVAVGPARQQLEAQGSALAALAALDPPAAVASRVPWVEASGRLGLAAWSLERALPGGRPPAALGAELVSECSDFLVALHRAGGAGDGGGGPAADAAALAAVSGPDEAVALERLGSQVARVVADLPRGFGHGDFWRENLLVRDGRLVGVVDWASAGGGRLPLLDLLHLLTDAARERRRGHLGPVIAGHLLPWARAGGDELSRSYCRRVGFDPDSATLEALALAYWLDFAAGQLRLFSDRAEPRWVRLNVELVLRAATAG